MKYRLKITDEAAELLRSNARWYAEKSQSIDIARAWYDGFLAELDTLESNPLRGPLAAETGHSDFDLREPHFGSGKRLAHRALYRVVGQTVEVLSIRHLAQRPLEPRDL
jgi:plasmid stabilization system protein ParE